MWSRIAASDLPLDRQGLLIAMLQASSAAVLGADDATQQEGLKGRRFVIKMRFGCPDATGALERRWSHDEKSGALRVSVRPDIDQDIGEAPAAGDSEKSTVPSAASRSKPHSDVAGCPSTNMQPLKPRPFALRWFSDRPAGSSIAPLLDSYE